MGAGTGPAQHWADGCKTFTHRYHLSAGTAISAKIGYVDTAMTICRGDVGWITRVDATQKTGTTSTGAAAGFIVEPGLAVVAEQSKTDASTRYEGQIRVCIAQRTNICSESHDYAIHADYSPVGPSLNDRTRPEWSHGEETDGGVQYHEEA
jgi:hypothetical protein